ncbi:MAG: PRC-barrel domain-containing protein [Crocinitomicaceae bacterium]
MKINLQDKIGYDITTKDNLTGKLKDFLFDEDHWKLRYLDVDLGGIFFEQRVLIPIEMIKNEDWKKEKFTLKLKSKHLEHLPKLDDRKTVSREYEAKLAQHFEIDEYWSQRFQPATAKPEMSFNKNKRFTTLKEDDMNSKLRSFKEVQDYQVYAQNGKAGHLADLIVDTSNWKIISQVIHLNYNLGNEKDVMLAMRWIEEISYVEKGIAISLNKNEVHSAPLFDISVPINEQEITKKFDFTGKPI